jgi:hypothetical protein
LDQPVLKVCRAERNKSKLSAPPAAAALMAALEKNGIIRQQSAGIYRMMPL